MEFVVLYIDHFAPCEYILVTNSYVVIAFTHFHYLQEENGQTALHLAVICGHDACVTTLLMKGKYMYMLIKDSACF